MESVPAGSKTDPLLPKAKPISHDMVPLGKNPCTAELQLQKGVRIRESNNCANTRVSEEGERGGAPDAPDAEIALQPVVKTIALKDCTLWKGPTPGQGESVRGPHPKGMSSRDNET
ncbi:hypothetical protein TURU_018694 [Turdus rufiventris]|nr:hypothetical protein TURU_018694 [Turdus rufiventris]